MAHRARSDKMKIQRLQLLACVWVVLANSAAAQDAKVLILRNRMPTGITVVPPTTYSGMTPVYWQPAGGQHVIPRYANGVTHPAGQLIGWGPTSVIQATNDTLTRSVPAIVVTEDYANQSKDQWQGSAAGGAPLYNSPTAVLQPVVRDVTIAGRSTGDDYYSNGDVHDHPAYLTSDLRTITGATNATPIVITSANHGYLNGQAVLVYGVTGNVAANGLWRIDKKTDTTFELVGSVGNGTYVSGGAALSRTTASATGIITAATGATPIVVTSPSHGLQNGDHIYVYGNVGIVGANGWHTVANKTTDTFQMEGTFGSGNVSSGSIAAVSNTTPVRITTTASHFLATNDWVYISGATGIASGMYAISVVDADEFDLVGTAAGGGGGAGGTWSRGGVWTCYHRTNDLYHGYLSSASGAIAHGVHYLMIPGTAAGFRREGTGATKSGNVKPFDNEKLKLDEQYAARCYRGFNIAVIDSQVGRLSGHDMRDYGVRFTTGACQISDALHFWGIYPGPAAHFFGTGAWGGPLYLESSPWGAFIYSNNNDLGALYIHSCTVAGIYVYGSNNKLHQVSMINPLNPPIPQPICIHVVGQYNKFDVGHIQVMAGCRGIQTEGSGAVGLRVRDYTFFGAGSTSNTKLLDLTGGDVYYAELDVHVASATVGLDLETDGGTGRLQTHNRIHIRTPNQLVLPLATMIDMPGGVVDASNIILWNNYRVGGGITGVSAENPAKITCVNHGLVTNDLIVINDVAGTGNTPNVNSWQTLRTVTKIDDNTFSVSVNTIGGTYTAGSGWWGKKQ
jgi:hypothetical protein